MCVVSMIMDHYRDAWGPRVPNYQPGIQPQPYDWSQLQNIQQLLNRAPAITKEEIEEFRRLLERAREYDKRNHEPDCEMSEKREAILAIAKALGVEISFL